MFLVQLRIAPKTPKPLAYLNEINLKFKYFSKDETIILDSFPKFFHK
jgi:hypothetical protein